MYYEKRKNNSFIFAIILIFLVIIIVILMGLMFKLDNVEVNKNLKIESTGTDTVLNEFSVQDLAKNAGYSVVRSFKIK